MYLGETTALEMPWPAPRTGAEELPAGAGPSAFKHGVSNWGQQRWMLSHAESAPAEDVGDIKS